MKRSMLVGKIHQATITDANIDYEGSITLDPELLEAAGILPNELVQVLDITNGNRFETYAIEGARSYGEVVINGAAARLVQKGDKVIILAYASMDLDEARTHQPRIVLVDENNRPVTAERSTA